MKQPLAPYVLPAFKPSLRAALHLVQEFGNLQKVLEDVLAAHLSTMASIIRNASTDQDAEFKFLHEIATNGAKQLPAFIPYFLKFIHDLIEDPFGTEPATAKATTSTTEPEQSAADYYRRLFKIGTGSLGWTAKQTWKTPPPEIVLAYAGRTEFVGDILKAVFGTTDEAPTSLRNEYADGKLETLIANNLTDPALDRAGLSELATMGSIS